MPIVSYVDNSARLGRAVLENDYCTLGNEVVLNKRNYTFYEERNGSLYGFDVGRNVALSNLYENDFYVIRLVLSNVDTLHSLEQEEVFTHLYLEMDTYMNEHPGYYNFRMPNHIVDAIRGYNRFINDGMFCGGTVELISKGKKVQLLSEFSIFLADETYIGRNGEKILKIAGKSFREFQGQYHISPVTDSKAGLVYEDWLKSSLNSYQNNIIVGAIQDEPIAFVMTGESDYAIEIILGAVDSEHRRCGAYRLLSGFAMNEAEEKRKRVIASTQLDNFYAQKAWLALGMHPFYSIYNMHIDRRR